MQENTDNLIPREPKEDDRYLIYPNGAVRRKDRTFFLQWEITNIGYARVNVGGKRMYVHRLVASNFLDNPNNLPEANHKDENKLNNHFSNLEWCDRLYNCRHGTGQQRPKEQHLVTTGKEWPWNVIEPRPIVQCDTNGKFVAKYPYPAEAGRRTGFSASSLIQAANFDKKKIPHNYSCGCLWHWEKDYVSSEKNS